MTPEGVRLLTELAAGPIPTPALQPPAIHPPATQYAPGRIGRPRRHRRGGAGQSPGPITWTSARGWIGPLGSGAERMLVDRACREAERIAASAAWNSVAFESHRLVLDLRAELEQIDGQAHALAEGRAAQGLAGDACLRDPGVLAPELAAAWESLAEHVAALAGYAARVTASAAEPMAGPGSGESAGALLAGSARDEFAVQRLQALAAELGRQEGWGAAAGPGTVVEEDSGGTGPGADPSERIG